MKTPKTPRMGVSSIKEKTGGEDTKKNKKEQHGKEKSPGGETGGDHCEPADATFRKKGAKEPKGGGRQRTGAGGMRKFASGAQGLGVKCQTLQR